MSWKRGEVEKMKKRIKKTENKETKLWRKDTKEKQYINGIKTRMGKKSMKKTTTKRRGGREENRTLWGDKIKQMK